MTTTPLTTTEKLVVAALYAAWELRYAPIPPRYRPAVDRLVAAALEHSRAVVEAEDAAAEQRDGKREALGEDA